MKKIIIILFVMILVVGCSSSVSSYESYKNGEVQTSERNMERQAFAYIKDVIISEGFYNPQEARVLNVAYALPEDSYWVDLISSEALIFVTISGTNKLGGTINKPYAIPVGSSNDGDAYTAEDITVEGTKLSVANINKWLKSYWEEQGLD